MVSYISLSIGASSPSDSYVYMAYVFEAEGPESCVVGAGFGEFVCIEMGEDTRVENVSGITKEVSTTGELGGTGVVEVATDENISHRGTPDDG